MKEAIIQYNDTPSGGHLAISWEPLVRCKDCANGEVRTQSWDGVQYVECHAHEEEGYDHEEGHPLDWFCADGERR